jgi:hypothetical protein
LNTSPNLRYEIELAFLLHNKKRAKNLIACIGSKDLQNNWRVLYNVKFNKVEIESILKGLHRRPAENDELVYIQSLTYATISSRKKSKKLSKEEIIFFNIIKEYKEKSVYGRHLLGYFYWKKNEMNLLLENYKALVTTDRENDDLKFMVAYSLWLINRQCEAQVYLKQTKNSIRKYLDLASLWMTRYKFGVVLVGFAIACAVYSIIFPYNLIVLLLPLLFMLIMALYKDHYARIVFLPINFITLAFFVLNLLKK